MALNVHRNHKVYYMDIGPWPIRDREKGKLQAPVYDILLWRKVPKSGTRSVGEGVEGVWRWGEREIIYLSLHCRHQNDSWVPMRAILMFH